MLRQLLLLAFVKALLFSTHCHGYSIDVDYDTDRSASASANAKSLLGGNGGFASSQALAEASGSSGLLPGGYGGGASASAEALAQLGLGGGLGGDLGASANANTLASLGQGGGFGGLGGSSAEASAEALASLGGGLGGLGGLGGSASASAEALANLGLGGLGGNYGGGSSASANAEVLANLGGLGNNYGGGANANVYAQAQAQAQAQVQAQVQAQAQAVAQAQAQAQASARALSQVQAQAHALAQAQAAQHSANVYAYAQAQANAQALGQAKGQASAVAHAQASAVAQAQAASQAAAQAQAVALSQANAVAQAQAQSYSASQLQAQAQAQATAAARAQAEAQSKAFSAAQVQAHAQAKANAAAQAALRAQAQAVAVSKSLTQAQARANAQAQAAAQAQSRAVAASQALAQTSTQVLAQAEASATALVGRLGQPARPQTAPAFGGLDLSASANAEANAQLNAGFLGHSTSPLGGSAGASSRIVPYTEYIYPNDISGQSLVKCSKPGEFHYLNIQGQCSICACVQNYGILKPVCVNCNGCTYVDTGPLPLTPLLPDISSKLTSNSLQPPLYPNEFENKPKVYPLFRPFNEFSFSDSLSGESDLQFPEAMPEGDLHIPHYPNPEPLPQFHENVATPHLPYPDVSPEIIPFDTPYLHETYTPPLPQIEPLPDLAPIEIPSFPEFKPITNIVFPKIHINEPLTDIRLIQEPNLPQLPDIDYLSHFTHFPQPTLPQLPKIDTNFSVGHVPHYPFVELTPHIVPYPNISLPNLPHHLPDLHLPNLTLDRPLFIPKPVEIPKFEVPIIERIPEPVSPPPITLPTTEKTLPIVKEPFYFPRPLLPKNQPEILTKPELVPQPEVILQKPLPRPHTNETVLPWPPKEIGGSVSGNTNLGPLPGPHPHQSCRPYPTKQYFQHPWDECQVCLCQEFYSQGLVNIEVECYTKPSCCIELPSLRLRLKGSEAQEILTQNNHVVQNTGIASPRKLNVGTEYDILDKMCETKTLGVEFVHPLDNCRVCTCGVIGSIVYPVCKPSPDCTPSIPPLPLESIVYLEPECRYKEPNTKYQRDCQLCSCQPVFVYVVAACEPTGDCQFNPVGTDAEPNANSKLSQLLTGSSTQYSDQQFNAPNGYLGSLNNYASGNSLTLPGHLGSSYGLTNNDRFTSGLVSPNYYGSNNLQGPGNLNQGFLTNHNELEGSLVTSDLRLPYSLLPNQYGSYNNLPVFNEGLPLASQGGYQGVDSTSNNVFQGGLPSGNVRFLNEFAQSKSGLDDEEVNRQSGLQNGLTPFNNYGLNLYGYQGLGSNNGLNNLPSPYSYGSYHNYGSPNYNLPNNYNGEYYASDPISSRVISQPALQDDSNSDSIHQSPFLRILPADADYAAPQQLILNNSTTRTTPGSMDYITGPNYAYDELPKPSNVTSLKGIAVQSDEPMAKAKGKNENTSTTNDGKAVTDSDLKDQKKKKN